MVPQSHKQRLIYDELPTTKHDNGPVSLSGPFSSVPGALVTPGVRLKGEVLQTTLGLVLAAVELLLQLCIPDCKIEIVSH